MDTIAPEELAPRPVICGPPLLIPVVGCAVAAGFPSPAEDHAEESLDLTRRFIRHPLATFVVRASGESLSGSAILPGDYLVVDRSRQPVDGDVVIALVDGQFTAKHIRRRGDQVSLVATHPGYPPIPWREGCEIWGVVSSIHRDLVAGGHR